VTVHIPEARDQKFPAAIDHANASRN